MEYCRKMSGSAESWSVFQETVYTKVKAVTTDCVLYCVLLVHPSLFTFCFMPCARSVTVFSQKLVSLKIRRQCPLVVVKCYLNIEFICHCQMAC